MKWNLSKNIENNADKYNTTDKTLFAMKKQPPNCVWVSPANKLHKNHFLSVQTAPSYCSIALCC